jgi:mono/diheme cytochrome c family protein
MKYPAQLIVALGFVVGPTDWLDSKTSAQPPKIEALGQRELQFFESKIRPLLVEHCYACHSSEAGKAEGGLLVDSRPDLLKGGDSGPAVVVGDPRRSILMKAVLYEDLGTAMPPADAGGKLKSDEIAALEQWIRYGLPDPRSKSTAAKKETTENSTWWAFQPIKTASVPTVDSAWAKTDIDKFIAKTHQSNGLTPSPQAESHILLRRLHFDLTGLPPTPDEIASFEKAIKSSSWDQAYAQRVDELLASKQFGVHWGRHWLDVARFAESSGRDINITYPYAWRYRDYVIDSVNQDKPYDDFIREQLAGDLLPSKNDRDRASKLTATGLLAVGSRALNEMNPRQFALDQADEQIDTVFQATMGLTVACARCHDHKFDPIPQKDYTAVAGIFLSTKTLYGVPGLQQGRNAAKPLALPEEANLPHILPSIAKSEVQQMVARYREITGEMEEMQQERIRMFREMQSKGGSPTPDIQRDVVRRQALERQKGQVESKLMEYDDNGNPVALAMGVLDKPRGSSTNFTPPFARFVGRDMRDRTPFDAITDSPFFARGDLEMAGDKIPRGVPNLFGTAAGVKIPSDSSGRLELANWIVDPKNPMTSRVAVNRVWNWLLGQGLVTSVDNFGTTGSEPSHPELLDYLASRFRKHWSTKTLVREIVLTATYRQASTFDEAKLTIDPDNAYLWRMNPRRLEAESIRDAVMLASGTLDLRPQIGSTIARNGVGPADRNAVPLLQQFMNRRDRFASAPVEPAGRSIYLGLPRDSQPEILALFDMPDGTSVQGKRETTNVPAQSLFMMNSDWIAKQSSSLAGRITKAFPGKSTDQITSRLELAYRSTLGRSPSAVEAGAAEKLIASFGSSSDAAWTSLARSLFASAEFRYLD